MKRQKDSLLGVLEFQNEITNSGGNQNNIPLEDIPWGKSSNYKQRHSWVEHREKKKRESEVVSLVRLFVTPWTNVAHQSPPTMGFSRQEYWSGVPFPSPGDLPNPGIKPRSPALQADPLTSEPPGKPWSARKRGVKGEVKSWSVNT